MYMIYGWCRCVTCILQLITWRYPGCPGIRSIWVLMMSDVYRLSVYSIQLYTVYYIHAHIHTRNTAGTVVGPGSHGRMVVEGSHGIMAPAMAACTARRVCVTDTDSSSVEYSRMASTSSSTPIPLTLHARSIE